MISIFNKSNLDLNENISKIDNDNDIYSYIKLNYILSNIYDEKKK
jgi:hypothetical protein